MATTLSQPASTHHRTVALVGNPNTGKTTLFNALAGMRQRVGNYPGVTVETKKGRFSHHSQSFDLIDLPGTYSLAPRSPDEMVAVDAILGRLPGEPRPDVVIAIVDASNLDRNLYLTTQLLEVGAPVVVALNMVDVAARHGLTIDAARLEKQLGVPVVAIQANKRKGLEQLREAVERASEAGTPPTLRPSFPEAFETEVASLQDALGHDLAPYLVRRLLLDVGGYAEQCWATKNGSDVPALLRAARERLSECGCGVPGVEARARYGWIRQATAGCVQRPDTRRTTWTDRLDRILTHKVWGTLVFLIVMAVVFQSIFTWAKPAMDLIDAGREAASGVVEARMPPGPLRSLVVGGVMKGVGSVLVFLPQILILFAFIAVLEDCGYMARAAFLMDKLMARCGLSGKSFIPMLSSVACAVPGIMAARVIENRRDRLATILVAPLMSCSARLPVYTLLIGAFLTVGFSWWLPGLVLFAMYGIGLVVAPLVALLLKRTLLRGETPVFVMEMPVYKWPSLATVLHRVTDSAWAFLRRAGSLILASMIVVWALLYFPNTDASGQSYEQRIDQLRQRLESAEPAPADSNPVQTEIDALQAQWVSQSVLGRVGKRMEPIFVPLGWDWRIGMAAMASFPAREVIVGTLGMIYQVGKVDPDEIRSGNAGETRLGQALQAATWDNDPGRKVFTIPTALSLMVFFALCCQCASTLAVIRRETRSWLWPAFTFGYMTALAYVGAAVVYQVGQFFV